LMKLRNSVPSSTVSVSNNWRVASVCIRSFASACHFAHLYKIETMA
jgi:hypothetical protein